MLTLNRKTGVIVLALAIMLSATIPASAQSFGGDRRSTGEKVAIIAGSAAAGALLGGLLKGGKGALIGGAIGGGAGTTYVYIQGRRDRERYGYYTDGRYYGDDGYYRNWNRYYSGRHADNYRDYRYRGRWDREHDGR